MATLVVLSAGLLSSCGTESTTTPAAAPKEEMDEPDPSSGADNTRVTIPQIDASGIMTHKNAVPDSYVIQFKDEKAAG